jgi:hypothetical protein
LAGQYGVCVTGDHNVSYQIVLADRDQLETLLAEIKQGTRTVEHVPQAVPLPTLVLHIAAMPDTSPSRWRLNWDRPKLDLEQKGESTEIPSPRTPEFERQLAQFHELAVTALPKAEQRAALNALAVTLGDALAALIPEPERSRLADLGRAEGPPWDRHRKGSRFRYAGRYQMTACSSSATSLVSFRRMVSFER